MKKLKACMHGQVKQAYAKKVIYIIHHNTISVSLLIIQEPSAKRKRLNEEDPDDNIETNSYTDNLMLLHKELEKEKPCKKLMHSLMVHTFQGRRAWIDGEGAPVVEILNRFPPLESTRYVSACMF